MAIAKGYKITDAGIIPDDWEESTVGHAFEIHNNLRLPISQKLRDNMHGPYPYYGPTGDQGGINEYRVDGEFSLIGEDGDHFLKWREKAMTLLVRGRFNVNNHAHIIKGQKNLTAWFFYYFAHRDLTPHLTRQGAGRYKLTKKALTKLQVVLPPLQEQRVIATALSDVDQLLASLDQRITKKRDIKQATMQQLLTGKQRLAEFSGQWDTSELRKLLKAPITDGPHLTPKFLDVGIPFLSVNNLVENKIDLTDLRFISMLDHEIFSKKCKPIRGDLLLGKAASVGKIAIVDSDLEFNIWSPIALIRIKDEHCAKFFYYAFQSASVLEQIKLLTNSSSQGNIGISDIGRIQFTVPPADEQQAIANILTDIDSELRVLQQKREKTKLLKQGMMQELLTGRVRLI